MDEWMDEYTDGLKEEWMVEFIDGWTDRMKGWVGV